jgi:cysteine desulfurase/selenocysteine lyase
MLDWNRVRAEFPALANWTYLNTATYGQVPRAGRAAIERHLERRDEHACADFVSWFDDMDRIRELCGRLVNCDARDVAFVPNASTGLAYLMQGLDWQSGDEVLTLEEEFPNQLYQSAAVERFGVRHRLIPWPRFYEAVNVRTRAVLLSTVNYSTGFRPPIEEIGAFLRSRGVLLYVDGTQSVGALRFDVEKVRPAMLCVDAYKWMISPNGAGFVYVDPELRRTLPATVVGWRSDAGWRRVNQLRHGAPVFEDAAEKYEGGILGFPALYAMGAALQMVLELTPEAIEARVLHLAGKVRSIVRELGGEVNTDESQIVTACLPGREAGALAGELRERGIVVSARHGRLRISPHFYNTEEDLAVLGRALRS